MSVSHLRFAKSETRDLADRDRADIQRRFGEPTDWQLSNGRFFTTFCVIAAALTGLALVLR